MNLFDKNAIVLNGKHSKSKYLFHFINKLLTNTNLQIQHYYNQSRTNQFSNLLRKASKIMNQIMLERTKKPMNEKIRENQAGAGASTYRNNPSTNGRNR